MGSSIVVVIVAVLWLAFVLPSTVKAPGADRHVAGEVVPTVHFPWFTTTWGIRGLGACAVAALVSIPGVVIAAALGTFSIFWLFAPIAASLLFSAGWKVGQLRRRVLLRKLENIDADLDEFVWEGGSFFDQEPADLALDAEAHDEVDADAWHKRPVPPPLYTLKASRPGPVSPVLRPAEPAASNADDEARDASQARESGETPRIRRVG